MNRRGWAFRDRWNNPRVLKDDDVRRVISNWREYAEFVLQGRAKERIANEIEDPTSILYDTGRAVFDLELLFDVAKTQEARSITTRPLGSVTQPHIFALSFLTYCACCDRTADVQENPKLRSRIIWTQQGGRTSLPSLR